jgi:hypothetical protein
MPIISIPRCANMGQPALPQLYIVVAGHIRFHVTSFDDGHAVRKKTRLDDRGHAPWS